MISGAAQLFGSGEALGGLGRAGGAVGWQQGRDGAQLVLHHLPSHPAPPRTAGMATPAGALGLGDGNHSQGREMGSVLLSPPVVGCCDGDQMLTGTLPAGI